MRHSAPSLALAAGALAAVAVALPSGTSAAPRATPKPKPVAAPTQKQIAAAVRRATASPQLWATVNVCNTAKYPDVVGIRGQMPSLGFTARLAMTITVEYYSGSTGKFLATGSRKAINLGRGTVGVHQGGVRFPFQPPSAGSTYQLRGVIEFRWLLGTRVIGRAVRHTRAHRPGVNFSDPAGYSAANCVITSPAAGGTTH